MLISNWMHLGRKRHRSAAVTTRTEAVAIRPRSQDDIQLYRPESRESLGSSDGEMTIRRSGSLSSREDLKEGEPMKQAPLETRKEKIDAVDSVLLGTYVCHTTSCTCGQVVLRTYHNICIHGHIP